MSERKVRSLSYLQEQVLDRKVRICKAFANPARLRMLDLLGSGERGLSELQDELSISKPNLSQHLAILKSAGVVQTRRDGKQIYCRVAFPEVRRLAALLREVLNAQVRAGRKLAV